MSPEKKTSDESRAACPYCGGDESKCDFEYDHEGGNDTCSEMTRYINSKLPPPSILACVLAALYHLGRLEVAR